MNNFEKDLKEILTEDENIVIDENNLNFLKQKVRENAPKTKHNCRMLLIVACFAVVLCVGIVLGFTLGTNRTMYSDSYNCKVDAVQQNDIDNFLPDGFKLPIDLLQNDYAFSEASVFVANDTDKQMAFLLRYTGTQLPYAVISLRISIDNSFAFTDAKNYTKDAKVTLIGKFTVYEKTYTDEIPYIYRCIECPDYKIYISNNANDESLVESIVDYFIIQNA